MAHPIIQELEQQKKDYDTDVEIVPGFKWNQKTTLEMIEHYSNSRYYLSGQTDDMGREKPFYNIVNANVDVSVVATDISRKDIRVKARDPQDWDKSFLLEKEVQEWMRVQDFAKKLNEMNETRARYGGVLVKKIEKDGELKLEVPAWKNLITDQIDIEDGVIVETHFMTPLQLNRKRDSWDNIDEAIERAEEESDKSPQGQATVFEITGEFPETFDDSVEDPDPTKYKLMKFFVAGEDDQKQVVLWSEELKDRQYKYLSWKNRPGRSLGVGVVEEGEEAQVWINDTKQREKEAMELGSKTIFATDSKGLENNILTDMDNGYIVRLDEGDQFNQVNTLTNALPQFDALVNSWFQQFENASSVTDAQRGDTPPSGTPFRLQQLVLQQTASMFDYRKQEMGIFLQEIFKDWVIPHLKKKIKRQHILRSDLTAQELKTLDKNFRTRRANDIIVDKVINNPSEVTREKYEELQNNIDLLLKAEGEDRFFNIPDKYLDDVEGDIIINITNEQREKQAILESLSNIFTTVSQTFDPNTGEFRALQDPTMSNLFGRIIEASGVGISPVELGIGLGEDKSPDLQQQLNEGTQTPTTPQRQGASGRTRATVAQ